MIGRLSDRVAADLDAVCVKSCGDCHLAVLLLCHYRGESKVFVQSALAVVVDFARDGSDCRVVITVKAFLKEINESCLTLEDCEQMNGRVIIVLFRWLSRWWFWKG